MITFSQFLNEAFKVVKREEGTREEEIAYAQSMADEAAAKLKKDPHNKYWQRVKDTMEARVSRLSGGGSMGRRDYVPKPAPPEDRGQQSRHGGYAGRDKAYGRKMPDPDEKPSVVRPKSKRPQALDASEIAVSHEPPKGVRIRFSHGKPVVMNDVEAKAFVQALLKIMSGHGKVTPTKPIELGGNKAKITFRIGPDAFSLSPEFATDLADRIQHLTKGAPRLPKGNPAKDAGPGMVRKVNALAKKHGMLPLSLLALVGTYARVGKPPMTSVADAVKFFVDRMGKEDFLAKAMSVAEKHHRTRKHRDGSYS